MTHVFSAATSGITVDLSVGDASYPGVGSLPVSVDLTDATTTTLSLSTPLTVFGSGIQLTAAVAPVTSGVGTPTGTVEFYDEYNGATIDLGPGEFNPSTGMATLTTLPLTAGFHNFTAVYSGDDTFVESTSAVAFARVNGPPAGTVYLSGNTSVAEGTLYWLDLPTTAGGYSINQWLFNWGDNIGYTTQTTHTFGAPGTYTVTAIAINSQGYAYSATLSTGANLTVNVTQAVPYGVFVSADNAQYSGADTEDGGGLAPDQLHVSFTGPASQESYNVSIDFGDGSAPTMFALDPGQASFDFPLPQYAQPGTYSIVVKLTDAEGNSVSNSATPLSVTYSYTQPSNLALTLDQSSYFLGGTWPILTGSFTDPQYGVTHVVTVAWGDGSSTSFALGAGVTAFMAGPHRYFTAGDHTISTTVTGIDGSLAGMTSVFVDSSPPPAAANYIAAPGIFEIHVGVKAVAHAEFGNGANEDFPCDLDNVLADLYAQIAIKLLDPTRYPELKGVPIDIIAKALLPSSWAGYGFINSLAIKVTLTVDVRYKDNHLDPTTKLITGIDDDWTTAPGSLTASREFGPTTFNHDGGQGATTNDVTAMKVNVSNNLLKGVADWVRSQGQTLIGTQKNTWVTKGYRWGGLY